MDGDREPELTVTTPPEPTLQMHHGRLRWTSRWVDSAGRQKAKRFGDEADVSRKQAMVSYADWLVVWQRRSQNALQSGGRYTVADLCADERERAKRRYFRNGKLTTSFANIELALRDLEDVYGDRIADEIGAPQVADLRDRVLVFRWEKGEQVKDDDGKPIRRAARTANYRLACIQKAFENARGRAKISAATFADVASVPPVDPRDGLANESKDIRPVDDAIVTQTLLHCSPTLKDLVLVQRLSGMRPTEACVMAPAYIDQAHADVWFYTPPEHKTQYAGKARVIALPPMAVEILRPYLTNRMPLTPIFTPAEHVATSAPRKLPQGGRVQMRSKGDRFDQTTYRRAIEWACKRAGVEVWKPNQLRHRWATEVRRLLGIEAVKEGLSHASEKTSEIYAELSLDRLTDLARKLPRKLG